jgi:hypothetical protein
MDCRDLLPRSAEASLCFGPGPENGMYLQVTENPATLFVSDNSRTPKQYFALETIVRIAESTKGFIHRAASPMADPGAVVEEFGLFKAHTGASWLSTMIQVGREYYPMHACPNAWWVARPPGQTIGVVITQHQRCAQRECFCRSVRQTPCKVDRRKPI